MTTVVYRAGELAADSCQTEESSEGGSRQYQCRKLYQCRDVKEGYARKFTIGFAGGSGWRMFLDWVRAGADWANPPEFSKSHDFSAIVVEQHDMVQKRYTIDCNMEPEPIVEEYHAIGSGAKCAFGALDMGASAERAVAIAAGRDPYTRGPFYVMQCS
jgi:hypothetical protein